MAGLIGICIMLPQLIQTMRFSRKIYSSLCKHEVAVALTLRMLLQQPQMENAGSFVALDRWLFWQLASRAETIDI